MYFVPPNPKTWPRACWDITITATIKNCGSVTIKQLSNRRNRKNR